MSPFLFCLFVNDLGKKLNDSNLGIPLGDVNLSTIFFADDVVLVAKNKTDLG